MRDLLHTLKNLDERVTLCGCMGVVSGAKYSLLYHKNAKEFARKLMLASPGTFSEYIIAWEKFPDSTDRIIINAMQTHQKADGEFSGHNILFVASFHDNADTLSQFHLLHYLCSQQRPASITILLPFFSTGTMERVAPGEEGYVPTAATLASMLSTLPFRGGVRIMTYDVHALAEKFFFHDGATLTTHSAIPLLLPKLKEKNIECIVFPDEGAKKRFEKLFVPEGGMQYTLLACSKVHVGKGTDKIVKVEEGAEINGKKAIIVDDMTKSGKTLFACKEAIRRIGAESVSIFVTHGAFTNEFWTLLSDANNVKGLSTIYTTDSVMGVANDISQNAEVHSGLFEILPLAPQIVKDM
jgi:phosphoribosylpyrophosphate synthetase